MGGHVLYYYLHKALKENFVDTKSVFIFLSLELTQA